MAVCASGHLHSLFLDPLGCVWSCGSNHYGELGFGKPTNVLIPEKITNLPPIIAISAGHHFSLFVDATGNVWSCGDNSYKQLGLGEGSNQNIAVKIDNLPKIVSAVAHGYASTFLDSEGSVWSCGDNQYGQLGLGDTIRRSKAEKIEGLPKIKSVAGGYTQSLFLDVQGSVWSCGSNNAGELGLGDQKSRNKPEKIEGLPKIESVVGGLWFSIFLDVKGNVWGSGVNGQGQLGMGHNNQLFKPEKSKLLSDIVAIAAGNGYCSMFLDKKGTLLTCGNNYYGALGQGDKTDRKIPQKVNNIPPIYALSSCHSAQYYLQIIDCEGKVWGSGYNQSGQLGLGHKNDTVTFERIDTIPSLKRDRIKDEASDRKEKELFKLLEKEQSKIMKGKITSSLTKHQLSEKEVKEKMLEGIIGMSDWSTKWKAIREKNQGLVQSIQQHKVILHEKQQQLLKLTQEISELEKALSPMEEEQETLEFYDEFLEPMAAVEQDLKGGFEAKLKVEKYGEFTVDEVSVFLNVCGIAELVAHQREMQMDGKMLEDAIIDVTAMEIADRTSETKLEFYLKLLESGKLLKDDELQRSMVWRHKEVEKTLLLLKEWEISLDPELLRKREISICHLLFFKVKDFQKELEVDAKEAREFVRKLQRMRKEFEEFLSSEIE